MRQIGARAEKPATTRVTRRQAWKTSIEQLKKETRKEGD